MNLKTLGSWGLFTVLSLGLFHTAAQAAIPVSERAALIALYNSTGGDNWATRTNWQKAPGVFNDAGTECTWFGVTCNPGQTEVFALSFNSNQLAGPLPATLGDFPGLTSLSFFNNQLTGSIPAGIGSLDNLTFLSFSSNQLSGSIPSQMGFMNSLEFLSLEANDLTGAIPPQLGNLETLTDLLLTQNELTGSIPAELGNLTNLEVLVLSFNQLSGPIPPELGDLASLQSLYLSFNDLTGSVPPELGGLADLEELVLGQNALTGTIPSELGDLAKLEVLFFFSNDLTGSIPPELGELSSLVSLDLSGNELTGEIPAGLAELADLEILWLNGNHLTGTILPEWGNLANLENFGLAGNELTGPIPPELGDLTNLQILGLGENQLTGTIPPELGNLTSLFELSLGPNQLSGSIPPELGNLSNLFNLFLQRNQLTGTIPAELGSLGNLQILWLFDNQLTGAVPSELAQLTNLIDGAGLDLTTNHLYTDDNALREFLNSRQFQGDWESTQTLERYFAHFGDGMGLFSQVVLFNLNDAAAATGQAVLLGGAGEALSVDLNGQTVEGPREFSVPAGGLLSLRTDGEGDVQAGSVRVTTDRHVEGVVIFGGPFGLAGVGSSAEFAEGFVAPMQRNEALAVNTGVAVTNLSGEESALELSLISAQGNDLAEAGDTLPAQGHKAFFVTDVNWDPPVDFSDFTGAMVVRLSQPGTGTVLQTRPGEFVTFPVVSLDALDTDLGLQEDQQAVAAEELSFAHFADGLGALSSQILLLNASQEDPASVQVALRDNTGAPLTVDLNGEDVTGEKELEIGPKNVSVLATDGQGDLKVGSVQVTSDQPLAGVIVFAGSVVGAAGVGNSDELAEGFVAPMETDQAEGINTGIAVMSLEEEAMTLEAQLLGSDGLLLATAELALAGLGHVSLFVSEFAWDTQIDFSDFEGLLRVKAEGRTAATVIQTRPGQFATMPVAAKPAD